MLFQQGIADIRFGCGLSPTATPYRSGMEMLDRLTGPDHMQARFPVPDWQTFLPCIDEAGHLTERRREAVRRARAEGGGTDGKEGTGAQTGAQAVAEIRDEIRQLNRRLNNAQLDWLASLMLRRAHTEDGFRERLCSFWANHFTVRGYALAYRQGATAFMETALRPHLSGSFAEMLIAVARSPMMLDYLDQTRSIGPESPRAAKARGRVGSNENYARELMELHTLGVSGNYSQQDVQQMADLLTGLWHRDGRYEFRPDFAEPGAETVLSRRYGGSGSASFGDIEEMLNDLALDPQTARHLCRKLAVHFVSDQPSEALLAQMTERYKATGGLLIEVYAAMLDHPDAWGQPLQGNVKRPEDFIGSAFRALDLPEAALRQPELGRLRRLRTILQEPMAMMGQNWERPIGPNGLPEEDAIWINAQRYAARLNWALSAPKSLMPALPDPRAIVEAAFGPLAPEPLRSAVSAAATRADGIALIFASPAFQRM